MGNKHRLEMKHIGDNTPFGVIKGIIYIGERYYLLIKDGTVSLMPADVIEGYPT